MTGVLLDNRELWGGDAVVWGDGVRTSLIRREKGRANRYMHHQTMKIARNTRTMPSPKKAYWMFGEDGGDVVLCGSDGSQLWGTAHGSSLARGR